MSADYYAGDEQVDVWIENLSDSFRVTALPGGIYSRKIRVPAAMAARWQRWCDREDLIQAEMRGAPDA